MNKQDILNLSAGEELDMLVGKLVLRESQLEKSSTSISRKSYSKDASAMWDIINIFVTQEFKYTITNTNEYEHTCIFDSINSHKRYIAHSNNLAEAVCKAALMAAVGEEEDRRKKINPL